MIDHYVESSKVRKVAARLPLTPPPDLKPMRDLGDGWGQYISKAGRSFYYNVKTREKNWKPPRKIMAAQDAPLVGSLESVYSDANRSNTSSPLNESCHLSNSLNRSNGSLNSKSAAYLISSYEIPKVRDSGSHWKERSPDDLNRSSYNSSPVTGLSQSSDYSLNKSSRDSLNRLSPIDNIPSEEEGFELHDHVYKDAQGGPNKTKKEDPKREDGGRNSKEAIDTTFRIKPGWEEFYDESLDQIFYMYKDRSEKGQMDCIEIQILSGMTDWSP
ncbi:hypothetical protein RUM44_010912 [Polyplax serrata]|uniref:WW domain-containing protein n=1 Tax=Polyplax serrata TaxID=468196 RepID=A0ABR1ANK3_POLSC